jgi:hypothetical protein
MFDRPHLLTHSLTLYNFLVFRNALEVLLMYLRLDGDNGLIYVRSSKRRSKMTTDRSRAAADSDESGDDSAVAVEEVFY